MAAKGSRLKIELVKPDPLFLTKLTMPFFQATSTKVPLTNEVLGSYPSAGPYFYSDNQVNVLTSIRRNPFWKRGPGRMRPRNLAGLDVLWNQDEHSLFQEVQAGQLDEDPVPPPDQVDAVADRYGVNKSRFWVEPSPSCLGSLTFNTSRSLFKNNARLRRAVSWAIDRTDLAALAGPYAASPWTHLLPPGFPGSIAKKSLQPYATTSRMAKARKIARGHFRSGKIAIGYRNKDGTLPAQVNIVRRDLIRLGFNPDNVSLVELPVAPPIGWQAPVDMSAVPSGWCADYPDPYDLLSFYLNPKARLGAKSPNYWQKVAAANRLSGAARLRALGRLDLELTVKVAPVDVIRTYNNRYLFSARVSPKSLVYQGIYQDWDIGALALK